MKTVISPAFLLIIGFIAPTRAILAQLSYSAQGLVYSQNFDGLPASGSFALSGKGPHSLSSAPINAVNLSGWQLLMINGSNTNAGFLPGTGSSTSNGVQSLGASGSGDRALGSLSSGTGIYSFGVIFTNTSGILLNSITISFTAEQWRKGGSGNKNSWSFRYKTGIFTGIDQPDLLEEPNLNFSSVLNTTGAGSMNGNLPENQQIVSYTFVGLNWRNGEQLLLRWDDADEPGSDDAVGIDNFTFSAEQVEDKPSIFNRPLSLLNTKTVQLNFLVNDNNARTDLIVEYDTVIGFQSPRRLLSEPSVVAAGNGITPVIATLGGLLKGVNYYYRIRAVNNNGSSQGTTEHFMIPVESPVISTVISGSPGLNTAILGGKINDDGGAVISEKGIVWSVSNTPSVSANKVMMAAGQTDFEQLITGLPQGTTLYARAYAINTTGTAYGNTLSITTQTTIASLSSTATGNTNAQSLVFSLKTTQPVIGLTANAFSIIATGIDSASVSTVTGSGTSFIITMNTGKGNGTIRLQLTNDSEILPKIYNKPFPASSFVIDKSPPLILKVSIPDQAMKNGDTVIATIYVQPDTSIYKLISGTINNINLSAFTKKNDSTYIAYFVISTGVNSVVAESGIPVKIALADQAGNNSLIYETPIIQQNDPIDPAKPAIQYMQLMPDAIYRAGDTLLFKIFFSENTEVLTSNGVPSLKLTIGASSKQAVYTSGSGSNQLTFIYVIQQGDEDSVGIKPGTVISLNNGSIRDLAGNNALLTVPLLLAPTRIIIDGISPKVSGVNVPADKFYRENDTLVFSILFTKKVFVKDNGDIPLLGLTIGSHKKTISYYSGSGTDCLYFQYTVQKNDLDKTGVTLGTLYTAYGYTICDFIGNPAILGLKNIGTLSQVKIDAVAPYFSRGGSETVSVCADDSVITISEALQVTDEEKSESLTWKIITGAKGSYVSKNIITASSNGTKVVPPNIIYTRLLRDSNTDTLLVSVTDGVNESTKIILISSQAPIMNNFIGAPQYICSGSIPAKLSGSTPTGGNNAYDYLWEYAGASDSVNFSKATGVNTMSEYSSSKLTANAWFRRKVISGNCFHLSDTIKITVLKAGLWTGGYSTDWRNSKNWCNAITPSETTDIVITSNNTFQPSILDTGSCHNIMIQKNAKLNVSGSFRLSGMIDADSGMIDLQKGKLILNGTDRQYINGFFFQKQLINTLLINNVTGVSLSGAGLAITGTLQLLNGHLRTNDLITIKSTAGIGPSASGTFISGNISIEHLIPGGKKQYQFIGHPFSTDIALNMLSDSIAITGIGGAENGFSTSDSNNPSAFRYDVFASDDSLPIDVCWTPFTHTNGLGANAWKKYTGIRLLVSGRAGQEPDGAKAGNGAEDSYLPGAATLRFTGKPNFGDQELVLPKGPHSGYNLIANPYPAAIDLSLVNIGEGIGKNFWVWNTAQDETGGYSCAPFKSHYILPAFGAFFVKATDTAGSTILFTENCKVGDNPPAGQLPLIGIDDYHIELRLESEGIFRDRLFLAHSDSGRSGHDKFDGEKFINSRINFYSISREQKKLSVDIRPINNESIIPLGIQISAPGSFRIKIAEAILPLSNTLYFHDKYLNKWVPLQKDSSYDFETGDDTIGMGNQRFEIASKKQTVDTMTILNKLTATVGPIPASKEVNINYSAAEEAFTSISVISANGNRLRYLPIGLRKSGTIVIPLQEFLPGIYFIEIQSGKYTLTRKIIRH